MKLFVDESAWTSLMLPENRSHAAVSRTFEQVLQDDKRILTHNIAIGQTLGTLRRECGTAVANRFMETIDEAHGGAHLTILWIGRRTQREALRLFRLHAELDLDLYDFASYLLISRRRIHTILTTRPDFEKLGLKVLPNL